MSDLQKTLAELLMKETSAITQSFASGENVADRTERLRWYAYALYNDLSAQKIAITFNQTLVKNRGTTPADPEFFRSLHALQDFAMLLNIKLNG